MSNYPDGVTDAHPHFNPSETPVEVECESDEALVVPSFAVKANLQRIKDIYDKLDMTAPNLGKLMELGDLIAATQNSVDEMEQEGGYECQWKGEMELPVAEDAEWDCPRCGVTQTTDTLPDERDPDEDYERMQESRYDD